MPFKVNSSHVDSYHRNGYAIFRGLIPATLLTDLRVMAEAARAKAHEMFGPQAQRMPNVAAHVDDVQPYRDLVTLPELREAVNMILGPDFHPGAGPEDLAKPNFSILLSPGETPWSTMWHRDWRDNIAGLDIAEWERRALDLRLFNQVNCPLYEDSCTWIVPGSHLRRDTVEEIQRFPDRPIPRPPVTGKTPEAMELDCLAYVQSMPNAMQVFLNAGDYMLYRNSLWHLGNYLPYKRRATIHDSVLTPEFKAWIAAPPMRADGGKEMLNPHLDRAEYKALKAAAG